MHLERGDHDCHLYRTWRDRSAVVLRFVRQGLRDGEHCILVTSASSFDRWRSELDGFGVDVEREESSGALAFVSGDAWREPLSGVAPNSMLMARNTLDMLEQLLASFSGVRIIGDVEWDRDPAVRPDALCHWEATANLVLQESNVRAICQFDVSHYDPAILHAAFRTHPSVIWEGERRRNPYYEAPQILEHEPHRNSSMANRDLIDKMLTRISGD